MKSNPWPGTQEESVISTVKQETYGDEYPDHLMYMEQAAINESYDLSA